MRALSLCLVWMVIAGLGSGTACAWEVYQVHPFVEATADQLPDRLRTPAKRISLVGLQNDWIHKAIAVATTGEEQVTVTLSLAGSPRFCKHVRLRVVGFVKQTDYGHSLDPIFDNPRVISLDHKRYIRNLPNIYRFPTVTATARDPVFVWITADTRELPAGHYAGILRVSDEHGRLRQLPVNLSVRPVLLPSENPLVTMGWQWLPAAPTKLAAAKFYHDYGINATHLDADMPACRAAGFKFFMFTFAPSWKGKPPQQVDERAVDKRIAQIKAMIRKLRLKPNQWALYTIDEPNDKSVPNQVQWCKYLRDKWPAVRFVFNPGWGPGPTNQWCSIQGTVQPLLKYATIWMPYSHWLWDDKAPQSLELMKSHSEQVWFYEIMNFTYTRRPTVGRDMLRTLAWTAWKYRLQGASWYSLNAISRTPYADDAKGDQYGAVYYTVPARSLEALRQGIQEYKRLYLLHRLGADDAVLDAFADRVLRARHVTEIDQVRRRMDELLLERVKDSGRF